MSIHKLLNTGFVILDGATGTNLQQSGMPSGVSPEIWITEHKDIFLRLQKGYIQAGCDILLAPTFTCNSIKLAEYGLKERQKELTRDLVALSKQAVKETGRKRPVYIAGDISMTGEQLAPMGKMTFEEMVGVYKEQVSYLLEEGVDLFIIETMMSLQESRAALLAVKESCGLPVFVSLTYEENMRTLYGTNPRTAMIVLQSMGADAVGLNCSAGPEQMTEAVRQMNQVAAVPIIAKPNAGLPELIDGESRFRMDAETFADKMTGLVREGATVLGGCCGTTPLHIQKLKEKTLLQKFSPMTNKSVRALTTERNTLEIDLEGTFTVVGERINPTGKKNLQEELKSGKFDIVMQMAEEQTEKGAGILDINMGMNGIDEKERMLQAVELLSNAVDVPLSIDSSYASVIEAALRIYPGRGLINSVSLEPEKINKLLPVAKKYGAMFVLLPLSETSLPKSLEEKKQIIRKIYEEAKKIGLSEEDIIVDGLVTTIGTNKNAAIEVLETIRYCKNELNLATICGLSNISFGLPERAYINSAFLTLAIGAGLTMAIANPSQELLMNASLASDMLLSKKNAEIAYIDKVVSIDMQASKDTQGSKGGQALNNPQADTQKVQKDLSDITMAVVKGRKNQILDRIQSSLDQGTAPVDIIDKELISGINIVGELFQEKKYFLPQLMASAETMEIAVDYLEPYLAKDRASVSKGKIVMATVKGDIHDIGKNLVVLMLKNYGYQVIDLGKDVEPELIVETAVKEKADIIGLSALMTTTMMAMKDVVDLARQRSLPAKIIIGGAVVTESFADEIGADGYSKDASEAIKLVERLLC